MKKQWMLMFVMGLLMQQALAQVRLPRIISDGMVLQRNDSARIWGWASPHEPIRLIFLQHTYQTRADAEGRWQIRLRPAPAGGPYAMEIDGKNHITLHDIYIGDVWLCSGQSNMQLPMRRVEPRYAHLIAQVHQPEIRQFLVPMQMNFQRPDTDLSSGVWLPANDWTVLDFSATAYFFARALYEKYHVPIGLINASVGGTPIQAWMSRDALHDFPEELKIADHYADPQVVDSVIRKNWQHTVSWMDPAWQNDSGWQATPPWYEKLSPQAMQLWKPVRVPGFWNEPQWSDFYGIVWLKKTFTIPAWLLARWKKLHAPITLWMGRLVDADYTYLNGAFVGNITYQYPPRIYPVAVDLLKPGENEITVRLMHQSGMPWGFVPDKTYALVAGNDTIPLRGTWSYRVGVRMPAMQGQVFIQYQPTGLFNGMIAPLLPYTIRGAIWYQGESNTAHPENYADLFMHMIRDWREKWQEGDFPFLFVQLPNYGFPTKAPNQWSGWALLRAAQAEALQLPHTGMAVTIDIGEWNDVHPLDKKDVGDRLALAAEKVVFGVKNTSPGPECVGMEVKDHHAVLTFRNVGKGLQAKGGQALQTFQIAGSDHHFVWAQARIVSSNQVEVWNDAIVRPVEVRYAWSDSPVHPNLYNSDGLPAIPFQIRFNP